MIEIRNLTKTFGETKAVDNLSLTINPGIVGLVGHNGAGKSTLFRLLSDVFTPDAGEILVEGKPYDDDYTYLASRWAVPMLLIYNYDSDDYSDPEEIPCYLYSNETDWDAHTKWPQSAIDILSAKGE